MAVELHGTICVVAPPAPCDGESRTATWENTFGRPLYITGGYVWQGIGRGCRADVAFQLYIQKNPAALQQLLRVGMWDHYQDPTGANDNIAPIDLDGHYFVLEHGGKLFLHYSASLIEGQEGPPIQAYEPPAPLVDRFDYFRNLMGQQQQAFLLFSVTRP